MLGGPEIYFDTSQFLMPPARTLGNVGRGTLIGPGLSTLDIAVAKSFPMTVVSDHARLEFRTEAFNVLNRTNFSFPDTNVFDNQGRPNPNAGRITSTSTYRAAVSTERASRVVTRAHSLRLRDHV